MTTNILLGTLMMVLTTAVAIIVVQRAFTKVLEHFPRISGSVSR